MKDYTLLPCFENLQEPRQSLHDVGLISIKPKFCADDFFTTFSSPSLYEGCGCYSTATFFSRLEPHYAPEWEIFGRAYCASRDYRFTEFHCTLCSIDELKRQIEAKMRELELNSISTAPYVISDEPECALLEQYFIENQWNKKLASWGEELKARSTHNQTLWMADDHSCRPLHDTHTYHHQLAKLSLSGSKPLTTAAFRPCCRSFLMATCRQSSGDDLLGH